MLEFLLWCIGIGLFMVYGLPVLVAGVALIGVTVIGLVEGVKNLFKKVK